jgi:hypothetical protein
VLTYFFRKSAGFAFLICYVKYLSICRDDMDDGVPAEIGKTIRRTLALQFKALISTAIGIQSELAEADELSGSTIANARLGHAIAQDYADRL